jgi:hypothetical protein
LLQNVCKTSTLMSKLQFCMACKSYCITCKYAFYFVPFYRAYSLWKTTLRATIGVLLLHFMYRIKCSTISLSSQWSANNLKTKSPKLLFLLIKKHSFISKTGHCMHCSWRHPMSLPNYGSNHVDVSAVSKLE